MVVARTNQRIGSHDFCARIQYWRTNIDVIKQLEIAWSIGKILDLVNNFHLARIRKPHGHCGRQSRSPNVKACFFNESGKSNQAVRFIDLNLRTHCRCVSNASMYTVLQDALLGMLRSSVAFQATPRQHFVEAAEPAQSAWFRNWNERWVDWVWNRRIPAVLNTRSFISNIQDAQPSSDEP